VTSPHSPFRPPYTDDRFDIGRTAVPAMASGARLLLVDDKPELLKSLAELVGLHGYHATEALGGKAALEALESQEFDAVLLDLIMPEVNGHDVLEFAAAHNVAAKIIVVSGDASFSGVHQALTSGAFDFLRKPYEAAELIATLEKALSHRRLELSNAQMEQRIKDSEELHRFIVNSSPDLVYMLDRNGCFEFLNDRVEALLGIPKEELLGNTTPS
jgi:DNA-binding NtrC family response regulator